MRLDLQAFTLERLSELVRFAPSDEKLSSIRRLKSLGIYPCIRRETIATERANEIIGHSNIEPSEA